MSIAEIVKELDAEIARLHEAKQLLSGLSGNGLSSGIHRPRNAAAGKRRVLSAEARQRIAEAQRKRWAAQKKASKWPDPSFGGVVNRSVHDQVSRSGWARGFDRRPNSHLEDFAEFFAELCAPEAPIVPICSCVLR